MHAIPLMQQEIQCVLKVKVCLLGIMPMYESNKHLSLNTTCSKTPTQQGVGRSFLQKWSWKASVGFICC